MKKWIALFLAIVFTLCLTACGNNAGDTSSSALPQPDTSAVEIAPSVFAENTETVFEKGTKVTATPITSGATYEQVKTVIKDVAEKFTVYDLQAVKDNAQVQPSGKLKVTFPLPADFSTNVTVYYVSDDGQREKLSTAVDAAARTVSAELEHFSTYVLADAGEQPTTQDTTEATTTAATTKATTTTAKPTTKATTTTAKPTTTTTAKLSAFTSHDWMFREVIVDGGKFCHTYRILLTAEEQRMGESTASPYEEMVPPAYRDEEKPDFIFDGIEWYSGAGGGGAIKSVKEEGKTITIVGEDDGTIVLTRTGESTAKVESCQSEIVNFLVGAVFTIDK